MVHNKIQTSLRKIPKMNRKNTNKYKKMNSFFLQTLTVLHGAIVPTDTVK